MSDIARLPFTETEDLGWHERALCAQTDPEAFFPEKGGSTREAKRVCSSCEVKVECQLGALVIPLEYILQRARNLQSHRRVTYLDLDDLVEYLGHQRSDQ